MSNVAMSDQSAPQLATSIDATNEQTVLMYMVFWMTVGTLAGAYLGWLEFAKAPGTYLPAVTLISAVTGSVVGAAIGQLVAGLFHIIASKSLD